MGAIEETIKQGATLLVALIRRNSGYSLLLGLVAAVLATGVTQIFLSGYTHLSETAYRWFLIPEFFALWIVITATAFILSIRDDQIKSREKGVADREAELAKRDTVIRRSLEGAWQIEYHRWIYGPDGAPRRERDHDVARFLVDEETAKLRINVSVRDVSGWQQDDISIDATSIRPARFPHTLDYYHSMRLTTADGTAQADGEIFVHLDIERGPNESVVALKGTWYDLQGQFANAMKKISLDKGDDMRSDLPAFGDIKFTPYLMTDKARGS